MELKNTIDGMLSEDYRERFKAEYWQVKIRYEKLKTFITRIKGDEPPKHDCPLFVLEEQLHYMGYYMRILEDRAALEKINLNSK